MKIYTYEGKNLEELTLQALKELEVIPLKLAKALCTSLLS